MDKGEYFRDLGVLQQNLSVDHKRYFGQMMLNIYFSLIGKGDTKTNAKNNYKQVLYESFKLIHTKLIIKKYKSTDLIVWVAEANHLTQQVPITEILRGKGTKITYISYKKNLLNDPRLNGYDKVWVPLPSRKNASDKLQKKCKDEISKAIKTGSYQHITEADTNTIAEAYSAQINFAGKLTHYFEKLLQVLKPKAAMIGYDIPAEGRTLTDVLNSKDIPTIMVQHGAMAKVDGLFGTHIAKTILVYGEISKKVLSDSGCKSDIKITGAPYLDSLVQKLHTAGSRPKGKLKVLVAFSGPGHLTSLEHHTKSIAAVVKVARKNTETANFYFKLHSKDNRSYYTSAMGDKKPTNVYFNLPDTQSNNIFDWALFADIMLTGASTVAIEAMLCRKPVISLDLTGDYKQLSFIKEGAVKYITAETDLEILIGEAVVNNFGAFDATDNKAAMYAQQFYGPADGQAAKRCAQLIESYLN